MGEWVGWWGARSGGVPDARVTGEILREADAGGGGGGGGGLPGRMPRAGTFGMELRGDLPPQ